MNKNSFILDVATLRAKKFLDKKNKLRNKHITVIKSQNTTISFLFRLKPVTDKIIYPIQVPRIKSGILDVLIKVCVCYFFNKFLFFTKW